MMSLGFFGATDKHLAKPDSAAPALTRFRSSALGTSIAQPTASTTLRN